MKSPIRAVKLLLSSIVQILIGPLSLVVDVVLLPPPQAAVKNARATSATDVTRLVKVLLISNLLLGSLVFGPRRGRGVTGRLTGVVGQSLISQ